MTERDITEKLIKIFSDTRNMCSSNRTLMKSCEYTKNTLAFFSDDSLEELTERKYNSECKVIVSEKRFFEAASFYVSNNLRTCVLNFANYYVPGGGVVYGSRAQEESLCRASTLYESLNGSFANDAFYSPHCETENPFGSDELLYSQDIKVFKDDKLLCSLLPEEKWFDVDVITCAAPEVRVTEGYESVTDEELYKVFEKRINFIFKSALSCNVDVLIAGAYGCGAFRNPPEIVAKAFKNVLEKYRYSFKAVEFAVAHPENNSVNYDVFKKIIEG